MREISSSELLNKYIKNKDLNILAFVVTPWAAHGVDAFLEYVVDQGINPKGTIVVVKHGQAGYIVDDSHFSADYDGICFYRLNDEKLTYTLQEKIKEKIGVYKENLITKQRRGTELFILNQGSINFEWHARLKQLHDRRFVQSVVIDEGIGMYMRDKKAWLQEDLSNVKTLKQKVSIFSSIYILNPLMRNHLKNSNEYKDFCLLKKCNSSGFEPNFNAVMYYRNAIKKFATSTGDLESYIYESAVVINTQPFYEYGQICNDEDLNALKRVCELCKKKGLKVVLKPHPREKNIDRYGVLEYCVIDERKGITQESIICSLRVKPKVIVGFTSTTLVSEEVFDQIPAISLVACIDLENIETKMRTDFFRFQRTFGNIVMFPRDYDEVGFQLDRLL